MEGQTGVGWSLACASADGESAEGMEGEEGSGSCKDCPIFAFEGVLVFGATFAWRSSKLITEGFLVTQFSVGRDAVSSFKDICDVVLVLSTCKSVCLSNANKEERADLVG